MSKVTILSSRARPGLAYYEDIYFKYELADQVRHDKIDFCNTSIINSNMKHQITILLVFSLLFPSFLQAKKDREQIDRGIHSSTFIPKGQWMVGGSFSYSESNSDDYKFLILKNVEGKRYSFSVSPNFGYFIRDNVAVGGRFSYTRDYIDIGNLDIDLNEDLSFKINNASLLQHMIYGTGFVRTYINLGNSKRFGQENKLLQMIGTKPMYRYGLDRLIDLCKDHEGFEIIVVTQYQEIMKQTQYDPITTVFCPESKYGISWSIKAGIKAAKDAEFYTFFVADQPNMTRETIERFLSFMADESCELGCVRTEENLGNPVWFSKKYKRELLSLTKDQGGKKILKKHIENARFFKVLEETELCDIDYPKEMQAMLAKRGKSS